MDRLELAAGTPLGVDGDARDVGAADVAERRVSVREALEAELVVALRRAPCVVSFSGGRDSSALLALAVRVARREGLPDPVPLTWRFPRERWTDESDWQEMVIAYLGVQDWEVREFAEELEVLGDVATDALRRHGLLWPASIHLQIPALERSRGGSLLVAMDAPHLFDGWRLAQARGRLSGRRLAPPRDAAWLVASALPRPGRDQLNRRDRRSHFPWLRPAALRALVARGEGPLAQPRRWDRFIDHYVGRRRTTATSRSLRALAQPYDALVVQPFLSRSVTAALAREGEAAGLGGGEAIRRWLYGDIVPDVVLRRPHTTTEFGSVLWATRCRAFAESWNGAGVDPDLVDAARLREIWRGPPYLYASTIAQAIWLASARPRA